MRKVSWQNKGVEGVSGFPHLTQLVKCENLKPPQSVHFATTKDGLAHYKDKRQKRQEDKGQTARQGEDKARWAGERVTMLDKSKDKDKRHGKRRGAIE
jgi:hypothetical protein